MKCSIFEPALRAMDRENQKDFAEKIKSLNINQLAEDTKTTLLHEVCKHPKVAACYLELLFKKSANFTLTDQYGRTPFHYVCSNNKVTVEILQTLLPFRFFGKHADPNVADHYGSTALHYLCLNPRATANMATLLFQYQANPNLQDQYGQTPLHFTCKHGIAPKVIDVLLDNGADPNILDDDRNSPLHYAAINSAITIISIKKILGKTEKFINKEGDTPADWLCREEAPRLEVLNCFLENERLKIVTFYKTDKTLSHYACMERKLNLALLQVLAGHDFFLYAKDSSNRTPLHYLFMNESFSEEIAFPLLQTIQRKINIKSRSAESDYNKLRLLLADILNHLCQYGSPSVTQIDFLISKNAHTVNWNYLNFACNNEKISPDVVKILLEALINETDNNGKTFLDYVVKNKYLFLQLQAPGYKEILFANFTAIVNSDIKTIQILINENVLDRHAQDKFGSTLLSTACKTRDIDKIRFFLDQKIDPNKTDNNGNTALHILCNNNNISQESIEAIKILIEAGADPNITNQNGETALYILCSNHCFSEKSIEAMQILINAGADPNIINKNGETPLHSIIDKYHSGDTSRLDNATNLLLKGKANSHLNFPNGNSYIDSICQLSLTCEKLLFLLKLFFDFKNTHYSAYNNQHQTPLHVFFKTWNLTKIKSEKFDFLPIIAYLSEKYDINAQDSEGNTVLHYVCSPQFYSEHICFHDSKKGMRLFENIIQTLLDKGALFGKNNLGQTPLHLLCQSNKKVFFATINLFIEKNCDPFEKDNDEKNALDYTVSEDYYSQGSDLILFLCHQEKIKIEVIKYLLVNTKRHFSSYVYGSENSNFLYKLCSKSDVDVELLDLLIAKGLVSLDERDSRTALQSLCKEKEAKLEIMAFLLPKEVCFFTGKINDQINDQDFLEYIISPKDNENENFNTAKLAAFCFLTHKIKHPQRFAERMMETPVWQRVRCIFSLANKNISLDQMIACIPNDTLINIHRFGNQKQRNSIFTSVCCFHQWKKKNKVIFPKPVRDIILLDAFKENTVTGLDDNNKKAIYLVEILFNMSEKNFQLFCDQFETSATKELTV